MGLLAGRFPVLLLTWLARAAANTALQFGLALCGRSLVSSCNWDSPDLGPHACTHPSAALSRADLCQQTGCMEEVCGACTQT